MLKRSDQLQDITVASLHTGRDIDVVGAIVLNPFDLSVAGFHLTEDPGKILLVSDIREIGAGQFIVDSSDVIAEEGDLLRLKDVLKLNYQLVGKQVRSKSGQKLGHVKDYVIDDVSWKVQKLHVKQPIWKSLTEATLIIDRRQVIEVNDHSVTVEDTTLRAGKLAPQQTV
ncbi:MAG: hypothetical protein WD467_02605 [Candidatus Saccharimonadales bacterium]